MICGYAEASLKSGQRCPTINNRGKYDTNQSNQAADKSY